MATYVATIPYADRAYADMYFSERLKAELWTGATDDNKDKALKMATRIIDTLNFVGFKNDFDQIREFPRNGEASIPTEAIDACCEVAMELLRGNTLEKMMAAIGISSESIGDASRSYEAGGALQLLDANLGLPSQMAARYLSIWLKDEEVFDIVRTK